MSPLLRRLTPQRRSSRTKQIDRAMLIIVVLVIVSFVIVERRLSLMLDSPHTFLSGDCTACVANVSQDRLGAPTANSSPVRMEVIVPNLIADFRSEPVNIFESMEQRPLFGVRWLRYQIKAESNCHSFGSDIEPDPSRCWSIRSPFDNNRTISVTLPHGVDEWLQDNVTMRKAQQFRHFQSIFADVCAQYSDPSASRRLWFLLMDDDISLCEDAEVYLPFILDFAENNREHLAAVRIGVGSNGLLMSRETLCSFQRHLEKLFSSNIQQETTDRRKWAIDEVMDVFLLQRLAKMCSGAYLAFHHNLLHHDNSLASTIDGHEDSHRIYGVCGYPLYWPGVLPQIPTQLKDSSFIPYQNENWVNNAMWIPKLPSRASTTSDICSQSLMSPAQIQDLRVVVADSNETCTQACAKQAVQCNVGFMPLIDSTQSLGRLSECSAGITDGSLEFAAPFVQRQENGRLRCHRRGFGCATLGAPSDFCDAEPERDDWNRICPCSS